MGAALQTPELTDAQKRELQANFAFCKSKLKGPYGDNYCVCRDGKERPVQVRPGARESPDADWFRTQATLLRYRARGASASAPFRPRGCFSERAGPRGGRYDQALWIVEPVTPAAYPPA